MSIKICFLGEIRKNISKCRLLKVLPSMQSVLYDVDYSLGNTYHCGIRNNCSNLNEDLFNNHLKLTAACDCGFESEDAEHYFFFCNRFTQQRTSLFQAIRKFQPVGIRLLLYGSPDLSDDDNVELFSHVQHFIKETNRF